MSKKISSLFTLTFALLTITAWAGQDNVRLMRMTMQDGTTKQFLVDHMQKITFVADKQDSSGMKDLVPGESESGLPDEIDVSTQVQFGAVTISEDRKKAFINGAYNGSDKMYFTEDITVGSVSFDRVFNTTLTGNLYSTVMLPFSIDRANVSGARIYDLSIETNPKVRIVATLKESGRLEAYKPYLLQATEKNLSFTGAVTFEKFAKKPIVNGDWEFRGTYNYFVFGDSTELMGFSWGYSANGSENISAGQFVKMGKSAYMYPLRAYLVYTGPKPRNSVLKKSTDDSGTANINKFPGSIEVEFVEHAPVEDGGNDAAQFNSATGSYRFDRWYDLKGRDVKQAPKAQGKYYNKANRKTVR